MSSRRLFSLLGAAAFFITAGCSPEYAGERLYWYAELAAKPVSKDPAKASPEQVAAAVKGFEDVINRAGGTASAVRAQFAIGSLYLMRREYPKAREAYRLAIRNFGQFRQFAYAARVALAKIYQAEHDRAGAIRVYKEIISEHPWTAVGIQAPLLLAESAKREADDSDAETALHDAIAHYESLAGKAPSKEADLRLRAQLTTAYQRAGQWDKVMELLEGFSREKSGVNQAGVLSMMAAVKEKLADAAEMASDSSEVLLNLPKEPQSEELFPQ